VSREHSILVTMQDKTSPVLNSLMNSNRQFNQSMQNTIRLAQDYQKRQDAISTQLGKAKTAHQAATEALKEATKAWKENKNEMTTSEMEKASIEVQKLTGDVKNLTQAQKDAGRETSNIYTQIRREESSLSGIGAGSGGMLSQLGQAGFTKMAGDLAANMASVAVSSAFGDMAGGIFESTLSGAATGAAMGSIVPGIGTAAGAAIGGALGLAGGALGVAGQYDDAFSGFVQDTTGQVMANQGSYSGIGGQREQDMIAFTSRLGAEGADSFLADVRQMSIDTTYDYDQITQYAKRMLNFADTDEILSLLGALSDTSAGLGLNSGDVDQMIHGFQLMRVNSGTNVTDRSLDYFSNRGVDVYEAIGDYLGVDKGSVAGMVTKRQISNDDAYAAIVQYMENNFAGLSDALAGSFVGMMDNLGDMQADQAAAWDEGYMAKKQEGIAAEMESLEGESGALMQEANRLMGEYQAFTENEAERLQREAREAVMLGIIPDGFSPDMAKRLGELSEEFATAMASGSKDAGAMAGNALKEAQGIAMMEYNATIGQDLLDSEMSLAHHLAENAATNAAFWNLGIRRGEAYSKGLAATIRGSNAGIAGDGLGGGVYDSFGYQPFAYGLNYVPYDGFPAVLHEGERVLTAGQARAADGGSGSGGSIYIGEVRVYGADEEQARRAAEIVAERVREAAMLMA